ncbi:hypothetical protein BJV82DRAFT_673314 [Fennellomyces sp. T-0311]|nr:hypothetical protein BJV82DRAFT_674188 [Fennellomyces sp. T-0311]KAI8138770.1 hypothetical protein BJV82DRAFT_673314 [Fennellomyces sp. T-0311]
MSTLLAMDADLLVIVDRGKKQRIPSLQASLWQFKRVDQRSAAGQAALSLGVSEWRRPTWIARAEFRKDARAKTRRPSYTVQRSKTARTQRSNRRNRIPVNGRASELQAAERKHGSCLPVCQYRFVLVVVAWHMQYVSRATLTCDLWQKGARLRQYGSGKLP